MGDVVDEDVFSPEDDCGTHDRVASPESRMISSTRALPRKYPKGHIEVSRCPRIGESS
jgi:hypothetical protein